MGHHEHDHGDDPTADWAPPVTEADWDRFYGGEQVWSGNPNGTLVHEVEGLPPGRALDVGAGEGGDALWLAEQGWQVTAADIAQRALERIAAEADRRGLAVGCLHADAGSDRPFEPGAYDLVTAFYASVPRSADDRAVHNLLDAVAPGGLLLVVGHELEAMRAKARERGGDQRFDPDAFLQAEHVAAIVATDPAWDVEVHETRPRPPGSATDSHHVDDVVLRARRRPTASTG